MTKLTLFLTLLFTLQSTTSATKSRLGGTNHIQTNDVSPISPDEVGSINDISELRRRLTLAIKNTSRNLMSDKQKAKALAAAEENKKQTMKAEAEQAESSGEKEKKNTDSFVDLVMDGVSGSSKEDTNNEVEVITSASCGTSKLTKEQESCCDKWCNEKNGCNEKKFNNCIKLLQSNESGGSSSNNIATTVSKEEEDSTTQDEVDCEALPTKQEKKDCLNGLLPSVATSEGDSIEPQDINQITPQSSTNKKCFTNQIYQSITNDIQSIHSRISSNADKAHFLGGIVRLAAHDLLDFNQRRRNNLMGSDGCIDWSHKHNGGLDDIWCNNRNACPFKALYDDKYKPMGISRADYWIAGANCVIDITSIGNSLGNALRTNFKWGRVDNDDCEGSGDRLPDSSGCDETERVLIQNMGLSWKETVALMGAHTLGSGGGRDRSGHQGTWVEDNEAAQVFDKHYYTALMEEVWRPRRINGKADWTTGNGRNRVMLDSDICLAYDLDDFDINDEDDRTWRCVDDDRRNVECPMLNTNNSRRAEAVQDMLDGGENNHEAFYDAFESAWTKATMLGHEDDNLSALSDRCE